MDGKTEIEDEILARISTLETIAWVANTGYDDAERADKNLYECIIYNIYKKNKTYIKNIKHI